MSDADARQVLSVLLESQSAGVSNTRWLRRIYEEELKFGERVDSDHPGFNQQDLIPERNAQGIVTLGRTALEQQNFEFTLTGPTTADIRPSDIATDLSNEIPSLAETLAPLADFIIREFGDLSPAQAAQLVNFDIDRVVVGSLELVSPSSGRPIFRVNDLETTENHLIAVPDETISANQNAENVAETNGELIGGEGRDVLWGGTVTTYSRGTAVTTY